MRNLYPEISLDSSRILSLFPGVQWESNRKREDNAIRAMAVMTKAYTDTLIKEAISRATIQTKL
ncbi:MAG: hypothetical protein ACOCM4_11780 [Acetivibrio ethanolgignens]